MSTWPKDHPGWRKRALKAEQALRTATNVFPGKGRLWHLDRLVDEVELWADEDPQMRDEWAEDILFLRRLVFDLHAVRDSLRGNPRKDVYAKNDPDAWREKERP